MGILDLEIKKISKLITDIAELGLRLGFEDPEVQAFDSANRVNLTKRVGTHDMLREWCDKDGSTRSGLVKALRDSEWLDLHVGWMLVSLRTSIVI